MASALDIMLEAPIGGAAYNNEFGRPNLTGYFRSFELKVPGAKGSELRGYHKPIMIAGGYGNIRENHVLKERYRRVRSWWYWAVLPCSLGLAVGPRHQSARVLLLQRSTSLSVQRANPEMERRCQGGHRSMLGFRGPKPHRVHS